MLSRSLLLAIVVSFDCIGMAPAPALAGDFVERSQACLAHIKRRAPGTHLKGALEEKSCPLEQFAKSYSGEPKHSWLGTGAACRGDLAPAPAALGAGCGRGSDFLKTLDAGLARIDIGGGRCLHVAPIMLTDKPDGFKCNAIKPRTACVLDVRHGDGKTTVVLASGRGQGASRVEIVVPENPRREIPLMRQASDGTLYMLMPGEFTLKGDKVDALGYVRHQADAYRKECSQGADYCAKQASYVVDYQLQQVLRRVWNPRSLMTQDERRHEREEFLESVLAGDLGSDAAEKKILTKIIVENEVGSASPYQVLDAVIRNSGLSWGAHQIDIGANDASEVKLFWDTVRAWRKAPGTGNFPLLRRADADRVCLSQPIRSFFVEHVALYYDALPDLNKSLRAKVSQEAYRKRFVAWLSEQIAQQKKLGGLFEKSAFARVYYIDQLNQRGAGAAERLRETADAIDEDELKSCKDVRAGEDKLVEAIKCKYLKVDCQGPPADRDDIERRVETLRTILKRELGEKQGRVCSGSGA